MCTTRKIFQLTPSRRATPLGRKKCLELVISTHALTEGDIIQSGAGYSADYFNSRPHGGRQKRGQLAERCEIFQLTPSRRATFIMRHSINDLIISTHALTEGDRQTVDPGHLALISTHALTEGDVGCFYISFFSPISTHALTEGDKSRRMEHGIRKNFNSRPHGGRLFQGIFQFPDPYFNSRPHGGRLSPWLRADPACYFNSRPHGGRLRRPMRPTFTARYFNSRPHGGRRQI